jgi:copper chaperone
MESRALDIEGMSCGHCVARVAKTLGALKGVAVEDVKVGSAKITYDPRETSLEQIARALDEIGFALRADAGRT